MVYVSVDEYAYRKNVTVQTVYRWIKKGKVRRQRNGLININPDYPFSDAFFKNWKSHRTYDERFKKLEAVSGVYMILSHDEFMLTTLEYIGSSSNLKQRLTNHPKYFDQSEYCSIYFFETEDYLAVEKFLIQSLMPKQNIQYNKVCR